MRRQEETVNHKTLLSGLVGIIRGLSASVASMPRSSELRWYATARDHPGERGHMLMLAPASI